jgi:hypothetical protein
MDHSPADTAAAVQAAEYVTFLGGPMDGHRLCVTGWTPEQRSAGIVHPCDGSGYGPGGSACYAPPDGDPEADVWEWEGDCP